MLDVAAGVKDFGTLKLPRRGVLELAKDRDDPVVHQRLLRLVDLFYHLYAGHPRFVQLIAAMRLRLFV